jgi:2'-5' RNA ligase
MQPGDRLICVFIAPLPVGARFLNWPLHITIVPWFRLDMPSLELAAYLHGYYIGTGPFTFDVVGEALFGYKKRKSVSLVDAPSLYRLEGQTRRALHARQAWIVDEADKTRRHFRPHVTAQASGHAHVGDVFLCNRVSIVRQLGGSKLVDAEVLLS